MALTPGTRLGSYEILGPIGAGGMGEVYKARDTRLDRTVAIKVLPEHLARDPERRQRFEREARAVSSLNHPNICTLHDIGSQDGVDFLVMEYLEGESLADRLERGPLSLEEALRYGMAIADALGKAHRQGVVHRDLKPGNVVITKDGAKLLDFGLAKLAGASEDVRALSSVATEARPLTADGAILGTFQYMAPEQLEGGEIDARTDIFAFGALLYEMVTGRKAFHGKSQASLIAAILERQPEPISSVQPMSPPELERLVQRCLAKDPDERWQSAFDLAAELRWLGDSDPRHAPQKPVKGLGTVAALLLGAVVAGLGTWAIMRSPAPDPRVPLRLTLNFGEDERASAAGLTPFAISPDGRWLVYVAREVGLQNQLYVRSLDQFESRVIPGTEGAVNPVFGPDSRFVAFWAAGTLYKVGLDGGPPLPICELTNPYLSEWAGDDHIYWGAFSGGLFRVAASGGTPEALSVVDGDAGELGHLWPRLLPNHEALTFTIGTADGFETAVLSLATGERRALDSLGRASDARYLPTGHLLYADADNMIAVPFDADRLEPEGAPVAVLADVQIRPGNGSAQMSVSRNGTLLYKQGLGVEAVLVAVERNGSATQLFEDTAFFHFPRLSPDGNRLVVSIHAPVGGHDLWLYDRTRKTRRRLTSGGDNNFPVWTPDGGRLAFFSVAEDGTSTLSLVGTEGGTDVEVLASTEEGRLLPRAWSPDGRTLAYEWERSEGSDIWLQGLDSDGDAAPFLESAFHVGMPAFSPDGRWVSYVSDESGQREIYVVSFPGKEQKFAISKGGGEEPLWRSDGKELFYRDVGGTRLFAVSVDGSSFGDPHVLFESDYALYQGTNYDVSSDGETFFMVREIVKPSLNVVVNWFNELNERVPLR